MKSFSRFINEAVSAKDTERAGELIRKYLTRKLGIHVTRLQGVERYKNSIETGYGIRYFYNHTHSIRFNWRSLKMGAAALMSVDVWNGTTHDPNFHLAFDDNANLISILPTIADFLHDPKMGEIDAIPADSLTEETIQLDEMAMNNVFDGVLGELKKGAPVAVTKIEQTLGSRGLKLINHLRTEFAPMFDKQGRSIVFTGDVDSLRAKKDTILASIGGTKVIVTRGGTGDHYSGATPNDPVTKIDADGGLEKVAYKQQLIDLTGLIKLVVKGASNALFIAGRGGTGKTHTVEEVLHGLGLKDGDGYFKNVGSASAIGIYKMLYKNRKGVIVFDDSDGALDSQDGRNLIKGATDTKMVRKIAWNKDSKDMFDPSAMPEDDDLDMDLEDGAKIPKWFEFTGKIIFISNLQIDKLDPDGALRTRALMVAINPTDAELFDQMESILPVIALDGTLTLTLEERKEVMIELRKNPKNVSLRKLVRGLNMRAAMGPGEDWKRLVKLYA